MATAGERGGTPPLLVLQKIRQILECFTVERPEMALGEIIRATTLPPSTCQRLVHNLVREKFLDRDADNYRIGLGLVRWSAPGTFGLDMVQLTRPSLEHLRDVTGETACLYVRDGAYRTVVSLAETRHVVTRLFMVGMVMTLHAGSAGKVFMAYDPTARSAAVRHGLSRHTARTIVDIDVLDGELAAVRDHGFASSFEERDLGAASLSAPVFGVTGGLVAALGIGAPTQRLTSAETGRVVPAVIEAAQDASRRLGYRPGARQQFSGGGG